MDPAILNLRASVFCSIWMYAMFLVLHEMAPEHLA